MRQTAFLVSHASPEDAPALAALHAVAIIPGWSAADFRASCLMNNREVLKVEDNKSLYGLIIIQYAATEAEVLTLAVSDLARRLGIGSSLMRAAHKACAGKGITAMYLEVAQGNVPARALYTKFGFEVTGYRKNYYETGKEEHETALIMKLDMAPEVMQVASQSTSVS